MLLCYAEADWASDKVSGRSTSGGVVTLGCGVLSCWAKGQRSGALSSWESELFSAITTDIRSLGIQSELEDLGFSCSVTVATDSQSVIDHSRRRGHSVASQHVGLRGLWLQEALADRKLTLENPADVCTTAFPGDKIRELCRLAHVYVCHSEARWEPTLETGLYFSWTDSAGMSVLSSLVRLSLKCLKCRKHQKGR